MFKKENHFPVSSDSEVVNSTVCHTICQSANNLQKPSLKNHSLNRPDFPTQAGTSRDTRKSTHSPCIKPFKGKIPGKYRAVQWLEGANLLHKKTVPLIWAESRPHSLNPQTWTHIWNKDYFFFFATVLSEKNNPSSSELQICWTCWARFSPTGENLCTTSLSFTRPVLWIWTLHRLIWFRICSI